MRGIPQGGEHAGDADRTQPPSARLRRRIAPGATSPAPETAAAARPGRGLDRELCPKLLFFNTKPDRGDIAAMLKIWGREDSLNVQKVMLCVRELGIPFEHINAGRQYGIIDEPWYLKMNPNGLIPTIDDDGFVLWESNAIVKYLCAKHSMGNMCPSDPLEYADADRWMAWQGSTLGITMRQILLQLVRTPPEQQNRALIDELIATTKLHWPILNGRLEGRDFIMGSKFTMVDVVFAPHVYRWFTYPIDRMDLPHLEAWYGRLCEREHYKPRFTAGDVVTELKTA